MPEADPIWRRIVRFGLVGGVSTLIHLAVQYFLVDRLAWEHHLGYGTAFAIAFIWSWQAHHHLTFRSAAPASATAIGWLVRSIILQTVAFALFSLFTALFGRSNHLACTMAAAIVVQFIGFLVAQRHFHSGRKTPAGDAS